MSGEAPEAGPGSSSGNNQVSNQGPRTRLLLTAQSAPKLARHVRLKHDAAHQRWMLLAPEKILTPSETALEVLQLCDGARTVQAMAEHLAASYDAPPDAILADILAVLQDLADQGHLTS